MRRLHIDIETFSTVDLRTATPYRYAEDPRFEILMAAWSLDGSPVELALGEDEVRAIPGLWDDDVLKVAHNAAFERVCFSRLAGLPVGTYLRPETFRDTMAIAGCLGYPQKLSALAVALGAEPKDEAGTRLINLFCKPPRNGPEDHPIKWLDFMAYCEQDVETLIGVDRLLGDFPTPAEEAIYFADQHINDLGIRLDTEMATAAVHAADENRMVQELEITALTGVDNPGSQPQMLAWLQESGLDIPNLQKATIAATLAGQLDDTQRRVLELRQELALVASKKYSAALEAVSGDGRLRGSFRYFGAHTGRWSGKGVQLQNLPRAGLPDEATTEAAILDLQMGLGADAATLKALVRPMFVGPFTVVDYAAIEARVIAWLAGETWALTAFAAGRDIYVETAERMGGLTRSQGKVAVLALGYAGGVNSLRAMGAEGSDEVLGMLVQQWRKANPQICRLWRAVEEAFRGGGRAGPRLAVESDGDVRSLRLPSGRSIVYRDCAFDPMSFQGRGFRVTTYGGRLTENATQAVARDVLAEALVRLQAAGHRVVGHVHDEILVEGTPEDVTQIMTEPPLWASGLPIAAEGYTCQRYRKA